MNRLEARVASLPTFTSAVHQLVEQIEDRQCVICITGRVVAPALVMRTAREHASMRERYPYLVDCTLGEPLRTLSDSMGWDVDRVLCGDMAEEVDGLAVVYLSEIDALSPIDRAGWLRLLERWAQRQHAARTAGKRLLPSVLVATRGEMIEKLPAGLLHLCVVGFANVLGSLESATTRRAGGLTKAPRGGLPGMKGATLPASLVKGAEPPRREAVPVASLPPLLMASPIRRFLPLTS